MQLNNVKGRIPFESTFQLWAQNMFGVWGAALFSGIPLQGAFGDSGNSAQKSQLFGRSRICFKLKSALNADFKERSSLSTLGSNALIVTLYIKDWKEGLHLLIWPHLMDKPTWCCSLLH
jgi:hypothetical protein